MVAIVTTNLPDSSLLPNSPPTKPAGEAYLGLPRLGRQILQARLWLVLGSVVVILSVLGYHFGSRYGLVVGFFAAVSLDTLILFFDEWRILARFPSQEIEGADAWKLNQLARTLAQELSIPTPILREVESETPFVFSTSLLSPRVRLFVSSSVVRKLSEDEIKAVFASELVRSQLGYLRPATAVAAAVELFLIFAAALDAALGLRFLIWLRTSIQQRNRRLASDSTQPYTRPTMRRIYYGPFGWLARWPATLLLRLVIRRSATLETDRRTVERFNCLKELTSALHKMDSYAKTLPIDVSLAEAALFTVDPLCRHSWSSWTSVRPPVLVRRRELMAIAGGSPAT